METTHDIANTLHLRTPNVEDGKTIWKFVNDTPILDSNSPYAYLLVCTHFRETSIIAETDGGEFAGYIAGYIRPDQRDTVFVWQIAVAPSGRRQGLAKQMLIALVNLPACQDVTHLEATVTGSNAASRRLFQSFAEQMNAACVIEPFFKEEHFPDGDHEAEDSFRIGPLPSKQ